MIKYFLYAISPLVLAHSRADGVIHSMWAESPEVVVMIACFSYGIVWLLHIFLESFIEV